jgi:NitT/TauT family transport system permease protein
MQIREDVREPMSVSDALDTRTGTRPEEVTTSRVSVGAAPRARPRRRDQPALRVVPPLVVGLLLLGFWQLLTSSGSVRAYLLPPPVDVARAFWRGVESGLFWRYGRVTLQESLVGFALGVAVAVPLGYGIARSRLLARAIEPFVAASQALPAVAIAPILVLWMGYGLRTVAVLCAFIVFFPMVVNTAVGIRTLDRDILDAARVDGAGFWPLLFHFELPLALPVILAGLRTALTLSITGAVVGEFVIGDRGLGGLLTIARGNFDTPLAFATIAMLMVLASIMYGIAWMTEQWSARKFQ